MCVCVSFQPDPGPTTHVADAVFGLVVADAFLPTLASMLVRPRSRKPRAGCLISNKRAASRRESETSLLAQSGPVWFALVGFALVGGAGPSGAAGSQTRGRRHRRRRFGRQVQRSIVSPRPASLPLVAPRRQSSRIGLIASRAPAGKPAC